MRGKIKCQTCNGRGKYAVKSSEPPTVDELREQAQQELIAVLKESWPTAKDDERQITAINKLAAFNHECDIPFLLKACSFNSQAVRDAACDRVIAFGRVAIGPIDAYDDYMNDSDPEIAQYKVDVQDRLHAAIAADKLASERIKDLQQQITTIQERSQIRK
jgi:hypothetical protein